MIASIHGIFQPFLKRQYCDHNACCWYLVVSQAVLAFLPSIIPSQSGRRHWILLGEGDLPLCQDLHISPPERGSLILGVLLGSMECDIGLGEGMNHIELRETRCKVLSGVLSPICAVPEHSQRNRIAMYPRAWPAEFRTSGFASTNPTEDRALVARAIHVPVAEAIHSISRRLREAGCFQQQSIFKTTMCWTSRN